KRANVEAFFDPATSDAQRQAILAEFGADYVLVTPEEQALGAFDPASVPYLESVFSQGDATVYDVKLDDAASRSQNRDSEGAHWDVPLIIIHSFESLPKLSRTGYSPPVWGTWGNWICKFLPRRVLTPPLSKMPST